MKPIDPRRLLPYGPDWVRRYVLAELLGKPPSHRPRSTSTRPQIRPSPEDMKRKL